MNFDAIAAAAVVGAYLVAHWSELLAFGMAVWAIIQAIQLKQYQRLLPLAGALAAQAALLADLDDEGKRRMVAEGLAANGFLAKFLTRQQIDDLVEKGWHLIAKPQTEKG